MCFESLSIEIVLRGKVNIYIQGDKQWKCIWPRFCTGHHVTDLAEITQYSVMKNRDPFKGQLYRLTTVDWPILFHQSIIHCKCVKNPSGFISLYA